MQQIKTDEEAWEKYPRYRNWFNKLYVSLLMGYDCGPSGIAPSKDGEYVVRPIYNIMGMGVGAEVMTIKSGDVSKVPPGYFWCEYFEGEQYSATYTFRHEKKPYWELINCWKGIKPKDTLYKFTKWERSDYAPEVPWEFNELCVIPVINIEFIGDKVIEVHLRASPDPDYDELIPIWEDTKKDIDKYTKLGYTYIESFEASEGYLRTKRLGFMVK